ncbi:MAG: glycosyltransferase family 39 protein [Pirellulaceae bacterium]
MSSRSIFLAVLLFTGLLRGGVLWVMRDNLNEDRDAYREIAENLATYRVYGLGKDGEPRPTAYRPPLYPVILAKLAGEGLQVTPVRVAILHWLLGMGTVWLTWIVAEKMGDKSQGTGVRGQESEDRREVTKWLPAVAAILVAADPILLHWSTYVMTETLAAFLAILALYTLIRFHFDRRPMNAGFVGCALGLAVLCRPTFLPWAGLCGVGFLFLQASGGRQPPDTSAPRESWLVQSCRRLANLATLGLVAAIVVFPWGYRNYKQFGKPTVTTTHGGYTLYLANNWSFYEYLQKDNSELPWDSSDFEAQLSLEHHVATDRPNALTNGSQKAIAHDLDANDYRGARREIASNPVMFAYSCLYRVAQLWSPLPHKLTADESWKRSLLRYAICTWYLAVYAAAIAGIWQLKGKLLRSPWIWGVLLCLVFTGVHTFYWSNLRMRAPLMPFVAILAGVGVCSVVNVLRRESLTEARRHRGEENTRKAK